MLLEKLERTLESHRNVFYFCKFDRTNMIAGSETLMLGDQKPIGEFSDPERFFAKVGSIAEKECDSLPILIPFDFVSTIYPDILVHRSGLPLLQTFEPSMTLNGRMTRPATPPSTKESIPFFEKNMEDKISSAIRRIRSGELLQVVLSMKFPISGLDPVESLKRYVLNDSSLYAFLYKADDLLIVGSSPENLVTRKGRELEIFPIAGTRRRSRNPSEDDRLGSELLQSEKDKLEHRMLVDLARNDLGKVSEAGSVHVTDSMYLRKYSSVQHLVSRVCSLLLSGKSNLDIISSVFPAGTVSGAPKKRALQIIGEYEDSQRGAYSGAAGLIGKDNLDLALLIRSIFSYSGKKETQAGAGIVKDSDPEKEVQEMYDKSLTVMGGAVHASPDN
ncbi:MAG: anthranilate synthase component I family protein [Thermoplasmata archaeon]